MFWNLKERERERCLSRRHLCVSLSFRRKTTQKSPTNTKNGKRRERDFRRIRL